MKYIITLITLIIWGIFSHYTFGANGDKRITGQALYSFSTDYLFIATNDYIYKIQKSGLSEKDLRLVDESSIQNKVISIDTSSSSIEFLWPTHPKSDLGNSMEKFNKASAALLDEAKINDGEVALHGKTIVSFSEPFFLIQTNDEVLRIEKSKLNEEQLNSISKVGLGDRLNLAVPKDSIQLTWIFKQADHSVNKTQQNVEFYSLDKKMINISGVILLSFDEPFVLIKSRDMIFQFKKESIQTKIPSNLNIPGSLVKIRAPISALNFAWPNGSRDIEPTIENRIKMN